MPAIRILLGIPAGNGGVERIFGKAKAVLGPHRLLNRLACLYLRVNAPQLQMEGYPSRALDGSDDELFWELICCDDSDDAMEG